MLGKNFSGNRLSCCSCSTKKVTLLFIRLKHKIRSIEIHLWTSGSMCVCTKGVHAKFSVSRLKLNQNTTWLRVDISFLKCAYKIFARIPLFTCIDIKHIIWLLLIRNSNRNTQTAFLPIEYPYALLFGWFVGIASWENSYDLRDAHYLSIPSKCNLRNVNQKKQPNINMHWGLWSIVRSIVRKWENSCKMWESRSVPSRPKRCTYFA